MRTLAGYNKVSALSGGVAFLCSCMCFGWLMPACGVEPTSVYERLRPLEWQIGDWVTEFRATADSGPIRSGDTVVVHFSCRWSPERLFMTNNSAWEVNGKKVATALEVIAWNNEKSVVSHSYYGTWGRGQGVWTEVGDRPELEWMIQGQYGTFKGKSFAVRSTDSWDWQIREQTLDGEPMPDMQVATFRRKVGAPADGLWDAYQKVAVGTWVAEGKLLWDIPHYQVAAGDAFAAQLSLQPEMDGRLLVGKQHFQMKDQPLNLPARIVVGWDPCDAEVRLYAFWGDGFVEELSLSSREGNTFYGTYTSKAPGYPTEQWRMSLHFPDPDSYEYRLLSGPHADKVLSSWKRDKSQ